jgi:hypothetical protein
MGAHVFRTRPAQVTHALSLSIPAAEVPVSDTNQLVTIIIDFQNIASNR